MVRQMARAHPSLLIVEDDARLAEQLRWALEGEYQINLAGSRDAAIEALSAVRPDLVLLDISLPVMDGYQLVQKIKENKEVRDIPVIAMTAHAMPGDREKCIDAGMDDYIAKPVRPENFASALERWCERVPHRS